MKDLRLENLMIEHQRKPVGIDCRNPRFGWVLKSEEQEVIQKNYQIVIRDESGRVTADTGLVNSDQSIEVEIKELELVPMTIYSVLVRVIDNYGREADISGSFETGRFETEWQAKWIEPEQIPTEDSFKNKKPGPHSLTANPFAGKVRDFAEFQPVQYIRIPFSLEKKVKKARIYATAHGTYNLKINGTAPDDRFLAPEATAYEKILQYQTYDVTDLVQNGENILAAELSDGWWTGRIGITGDSCQYGDRTVLLVEGRIWYEDGTEEIITGTSGKSSTGALIYSDIFVGEKYDARKELTGWDSVSYDDSAWKAVKEVEIPYDNLTGQYGEPVRPILVMDPKQIFTAPNGDTVIDVGQVVAGAVEFTVTAEEGRTITLEHSEVLDEQGNFFNNIMGVNKEQLVTYLCKYGVQTYRPHFTYHGFRYVRVKGWPGIPNLSDFKIIVYTSEMDDIGTISTSDERINKLVNNIWWSQIANTIAVPTDCPQRERAGWTGDIMAFAPTLCRNRRADAFLTRWMNDVRAEQRESGGIPIVVPYLKCYQTMAPATWGYDGCCGWGDAVIYVPLALYQEYGDTRALKENYPAMKAWMEYIRNRAENHHPEGYEEWDEERKARSRYLWNTDFHYGDWLVPSMVMGNSDPKAMINTARSTMGIVAPEYYAGSARMMAHIAELLGEREDAHYFADLYEKIRSAFVSEYIHEDGTMTLELQGVYVIALRFGLYTEELEPKMTAHLRQMIADNRGCLDTGFLSVLHLMDALCEHDSRETAYQLLFQTNCPSWLYEVEHGATTVWESWGAIGEHGEVSSYSYNHYAFGCIGEWLYREIGGLQAVEAGYKKTRIRPAFDCGLTSAQAQIDTPYGLLKTEWQITDGKNVNLKIEVPCNASAVVDIPQLEQQEIGSGCHEYQFAIA